MQREREEATRGRIGERRSRSSKATLLRSSCPHLFHRHPPPYYCSCSFVAVVVVSAAPAAAASLVLFAWACL